ncbi:MAG: M23 family metallopeptidase [Leptolyngbya sp. SIO1E4]|nr:M23 family metallopeptidase [Leptolyngbya sp. SIO1E4]
MSAIAIAVISTGGSPRPILAGASMLAQVPTDSETTDLCPSPALSRVQSHSVVAGETLESIATAYGLLPITLLGMNSAAQAGPITPGMVLRIPPFNGIEVSVAEGQTWQDLATVYQLRADILFEVNGCPAAVPAQIFVPGVNWFSDIATVSADGATGGTTDADPLAGYPLSEDASILTAFGWQPHPERDELVFSSGVTLAVSPGATALAVGEGTVAYVGEEDALGTLIVINHALGFQTRYGRITNPQVSAGDRVRTGQPIATTTPLSDAGATLYFEVRTNSELGWVARDPGDYIPALAVR